MMRLHVVQMLSFALLVGLEAVAAQPPKSSRSGWLLVANKGDAGMGIVDPQTGEQIATVPEGGVTGHELAASADGKTVFVPIYGDSGVGLPGTDGRNMVAIDIAERKVVGNIDFGRGVRPHCVLLGPKDGLLYVTTELENAVSVIDPKTLKIIGSIPTNQAESHMLAITHDGRLGYTTNVGPGTVTVLDLVARKPLDVISVAPHIQRIALSVDDRLAFTSDTTKPELDVIDTDARKVKMRIPLPAPGYGAAATPDGHWLMVAAPGANQVAVVDLSTMKVAHTIDVPAAPQEILLQPDGARGYVSCSASSKVAVIRTSDWKVEKLIDAGKGVDGLAWAAIR
jgi:YVTN family beta-propeller protein